MCESVNRREERPETRERRDYFFLAAILSIVVVLGTSVPPAVLAAENGGGATPEMTVNRLQLRDGLIQASKLMLDTSLARLLADSIPHAIGSFLLRVDPRAMGLGAAYVPLDSTPGYPGHGFPGQRLYVFSGDLALLYNVVVKRDSGSWRVVWSRTDPGNLPQPALSVRHLGIEGDSSISIGMSGLVSPGGYTSNSLMLWNGRTGRDLFGGGADWLEEEDLDHDGIKELILHRGERHTEKNYPSREVYSFDAAKRVYRSTADTTRRTAPRK